MDTSETEEKNKTVRDVARQALQRYYFYRRTRHLPASHRFVYLLQLLEILQTFVLLVPSDRSLGLPWNYELFGWLWSTIELISFPTRLASYFDLPAVIVSTVLACALLYKLVSSLATAGVFALLRAETYESIVAGADRHLILKWALYCDYLVSLLLLKVCATPIPCFLIREIRSANLIVAHLSCLVLFFVLKFVDVVYMASTSWFNNDLEAVSSPISEAYMWATRTVFIVFAASVDYAPQRTRFSAVILVLGVYKLSVILRTVPYHKTQRNVMEMAKGLVQALGGVVLFICEYHGAGQESVMGTLLFFVLFPVALPLLTITLKRQRKRLGRLQYPTKLFEVEQILRRQIDKGKASSMQVDVAFTRACIIFPKSEQLVLWALHYYKYLKDVTFVQVNISKLMKTKWSLVNYIECYHCYRIVEAWLKSLPEQAEPLSYWKYQQSLKEILRMDYEISKVHCELFTELASERPKLEKVVRLARNISHTVSSYNRFVQTIMKLHPICPELLSLYSDFLSALTNSKQAEKYQHLGMKVADMLKANRTDNSVDLYDSRCMIVVMSLEKATIGNIIWAKNTELLGFTTQDLIGTDHNIVIPMPLKKTHTNMLKRITMFRHHHPVYESRHHLYFAHHSGCIVGAHWKVRLVNLPGTGDMCIVAALKPRSDASTIAFVDGDGETVTAMVSATQTKGFLKRISELLGHSNPHNFKLGDVFGADKATWVEGKVYYRKTVTSRTETAGWIIMGETFNIFGVHPQKILKVYREYLSSGQNATRSSLRPVYEDVEDTGLYGQTDDSKEVRLESSNCDPTTSLDMSTKSPNLTSRQYVASLKRREKHARRRKQTLFSSLFDSKMLSAYTDWMKNDTQGDVWSEVQMLVKKRKTVLGNVVKWMDFTLLITLALALTVLLSLYFTTESSAIDSINLDEFSNLNERRELSVLSALRARQLSSAAFSNTTSELLDISDRLKTQISRLQERADTDSTYRKAIFAHPGIWWEFNGDFFESYSLNSMEILKMLQMHVQALANQDTTQMSKRDFLSVFRNGESESLRNMNESMLQVMQQATQNQKDKEQVLPSILTVGVVGIVSLFTAASYFLLRRADGVRRDLWAIISALPQAMYLVARSSSKNRLETLHNTDFLEMDLNEFACHSHARTAHQLPYRFLPEFKLLFLCLLVFVVSLALGLIVMYLESMKDAGYFSSHVPLLIFYSGLRKIALLRVQFFLREWLYADSYFSLCEEKLAFYDVEEELQRAVEEMRVLEDELIFEYHKLGGDAVPLDAQQITILFDTLSVEGRFLEKGAHVALNAIVYDLSTKPLPDSLWVFETRINSLLPALDDLTSLYVENAKAKGEAQHLVFLSGLLGIALAMLIYYLFVIRVLVRYILRCINDEWRMLLFFPKESSTQIYKLIQWKD